MSDTATSDDSLPLVGEDRGNRGLWFGLGAIGIAGLLLFALIESNRQSGANQNVPSPKDYAVASSPRPELAIPLENPVEGHGLVLGPYNVPSAQSEPIEPLLPPVRLTRVPSQAQVDAPAPPPTFQANPQPALFPPDIPHPGRSAPTVVYDAFQAAVAGVAPASPTSIQATKAIAVGGGDRTYLVAQGTLIFAVLETAIDSTQSGQVRAMISTNVLNALGDQVLIPKGSRIFGEYKGELAAGQNRAQVFWTRLIRPDGATIALDSPASDQLGRAGIKGRVDTHFGERLLGALLQSTIDFGTYAASRAVTTSNGVVIALPNTAHSAGSQIIQPAPKPTLKVKHGARIAVFVARDLDFSAVE